MLSRLLLALLLVAAGSLPGPAAPVTYWFSGEVEAFSNASNTAPAGIAVGTPFVGRVHYDPANVLYAETNSFDGGTSAQYHYGALAAYSFTVFIAGHTISNTVQLGQSGQIGLENNISERDFYYAETGSALMINGTNMVAAPNQASMTLALIDSSATALASTALPLSAPALSRFNDGAVLTLLARNSNGTIDLFNVRGLVTALSSNEIVPLSLRRLNAGTAVAAWPLHATGFTLQSATSLVLPNWQNVSTAVVNTATEHTVTVSTSGPQRYYRLRK